MKIKSIVWFAVLFAILLSGCAGAAPSPSQNTGSSPENTLDGSDWSEGSVFPEEETTPSPSSGTEGPKIPSTAGATAKPRQTTGPRSTVPETVPATAEPASDQDLLKINPGSVTLSLDDGVQLFANSPWAEWKSENPEIASVSEDGYVTALSLGKTSIVVSADGQTAKCAVTVNTPIPKSNRAILGSPDGVQQGDWVFFINYRDERRIYKFNAKISSTPVRVSELSAYSLCAVGNWVYFVYWNSSSPLESGKDYRIYRVRLNGTGEAKFHDGPVSSINLYHDGWLYCEHGDNGLRVRIDGPGQEKYPRNNMTLIDIVDGVYYYTQTYNDNKLLVRSGSYPYSGEILSYGPDRNTKKALFIENGFLYFTKSSESGLLTQICRKKISGSTDPMSWDVVAEIAEAGVFKVGKRIFYLRYIDIPHITSYPLYKMDLDGGNNGAIMRESYSCASNQVAVTGNLIRILYCGYYYLFFNSDGEAVQLY